jgi:hypothetical protein
MSGHLALRAAAAELPGEMVSLRLGSLHGIANGKKRVSGPGAQDGDLRLSTGADYALKGGGRQDAKICGGGAVLRDELYRGIALEAPEKPHRGG